MREYEIGKLKGKYVVYWYEFDNGRKVRRRFRLSATNKQNAMVEGLRRYNAQLVMKGGTLTLEDVWKRYRSHLDGRPTARHLDTTWKAIGPFMCNYHPLEINDELVGEYLELRRENFRNKWGKEVSNGTIYSDVNTLQCVLNFAKKKKMISEDPHVLTKPPRSAPRERWLNEHEIRILYQACMETPHLYVAVVLLVSTAGRVGAVLELTWDRINFDTREIDLRLPRNEGDQHQKRRAFVAMNDGAERVLKEWRKSCDSNLLFEYRNTGKPIDSIKTAFRNAVKRSGLEKVTPHVLRHTAAVQMVSKGCEMQKVSQYLGHSSVAVTEKIYARFAPEHMRKEAGSVDFVDP